MRKRHDHIDALLHETDAACLLEFCRNDRRLLTWRFDDRESAAAIADARLRELQRAGWNLHW